MHRFYHTLFIILMKGAVTGAWQSGVANAMFRWDGIGASTLLISMTKFNDKVYNFPPKYITFKVYNFNQ